MTDNAARQAAINRLAVALNIPEEILTVITPGPGATSTEALRAIEPNPHRCHQDPAWYCDGGYEFGPCREVNPGDNCPDPACNRYNGRCPCNCHQEG